VNRSKINRTLCSDQIANCRKLTEIFRFFVG
jgi:hypothetical protein